MRNGQQSPSPHGGGSMFSDEGFYSPSRMKEGEEPPHPIHERGIEKSLLEREHSPSDRGGIDSKEGGWPH